MQSTPPPVSIIALHGIADSEEEVARNCEPVERCLGRPGIRWRFPRAAKRPVTVLGGESALAWYDVRTYDRTQMDEDGIEAAAEIVRQAVRAEHEDDRRDRRVILMGFSQGGALALHAGLQLQDEVAGIVALGTALPFPDRVPRSTSGTQVLLGHGMFDRKVPHSLGRESAEVLKARGYDIEWHSYLCGHTITSREMRNISRWMGRHFQTEPVSSRAKAGFAPAAQRA